MQFIDLSAFARAKAGRHVRKSSAVNQLLRAMRLTAFILLTCCLHTAAKTHSQTVTLSGKNLSLETVFTEIKKQTGFNVVYNYELINTSAPVNVHVEKLPLENFLKVILKDKELKYSIENTTIAIEKVISAEHLSTPLFSPLPPITIRGRIVNEKGEPVVASVTIKGTRRGTTSGITGVFELENVDENAVLVITATNIETVTINLNGQPVINVSVKTNATSLNEVVVNKGYYRETRKYSTGNVGKVDAKIIEKQPVSNPLQALSGRIAGVEINQQTGVPGGSYTVRIRGENSIANASYPLYIIDGVQFLSSSLVVASLGGDGNVFGGSGASPMSTINPADIESIEVLKDADATAIYGSRGANGVILITTKKGKAGKTKLDINTSAGGGKVTRMLDVLNTKQYLEMRREAFANDGSEPSESTAPDIFLWDTTKSTDWQKRMIGGTSNITNVQAGLSGGTNSTQFLVNGGYYKETTVFPGDFAYKKGSVHLSLNHRSDDQKFFMMLSSSFVHDKNNIFSLDLTSSAITTPPNNPDFLDENGKLSWAPGSFSNPYAELQKKYLATTDNLIGNMILGYQLFPGFQIKTSVGYTQMRRDELQTNPLSVNHPDYIIYYQASANARNTSSNTWVIEPQAEYSKPLWKGHLNLLVGGTFQENLMEGKTVEATGFSSDALVEDIGSAASSVVKNTLYSQYRYNAIFGRINYNIQGKYLINLTARRDGSSRFGPAKRFSNFGAVGAGWIFSSEKFIRDKVRFLSFGKLRGSYGSSGNDQIGDYEYLDTYESTTISYQDTRGLVPSRIFNPDFAWERNKKLEAAIELGFINDRIRLSTSYYRNRSDNQLVRYALPPSSGFTYLRRNLPAQVQNSGVEFELNTVNIKTRDFTWTSAANFTIPRNQLLAFPDLENSSYSSDYEIGKSLFLQRAYHLTGVDPATGVYSFEDVNGDGDISSPDDFRGLKTLSSKYYGGLNNSFTYRGFQLDIFLQFVKQTGRSYLSVFTNPGFMSNQPTLVLDRWRKPGDESDIQAFTRQAGSPAWFAYFFNSRFYGDNRFTDASFIRLKNVSLSYEFPAKWSSKMHLQSSRIYLQAQNLLTITNYIGMDPESQSIGNLPPLKMITGGIQLTL